MTLAAALFINSWPNRHSKNPIKCIYSSNGTLKNEKSVTVLINDHSSRRSSSNNKKQGNSKVFGTTCLTLDKSYISCNI